MAHLKIALRVLDMVLGLPEGSITAIELDNEAPSLSKVDQLIDVTVADVVFAPDAEVMAFQELHDCDGTRWFRTKLVVPEPVARVVTMPPDQRTATADGPGVPDFGPLDVQRRKHD